MFSGEIESYIQDKYPNVIFTKLIYCTFQNDGKDKSPKEIKGHETQSMITSVKVDVEMHSLENSEKDSSQISEKGYFCKWVKYEIGDQGCNEVSFFISDPIFLPKIPFPDPQNRGTSDPWSH